MWRFLRLLFGSSLVKAAAEGDIDRVKLLLGTGVSPSGPWWLYMDTPIEFAIAKGHVSIVWELLNAGARPDDGLFAAIRAGRTDFVRLLVEKGAGAEDGPALQLASACGALDIVSLLVDAGADVSYGWVPANTYLRAAGEHVLIEGPTPLHCAALSGHTNVALFLIERGANPRVKDSIGRTAAEVARGTAKEAIETAVAERRQRREGELLLAGDLARSDHARALGDEIVLCGTCGLRYRLRDFVIESTRTEIKTRDEARYEGVHDGYGNYEVKAVLRQALTISEVDDFRRGCPHCHSGLFSFEEDFLEAFAPCPECEYWYKRASHRRCPLCFPAAPRRD